MPSTRIRQEQEIVEQMVRLYCRQKEGHTDLCPDCNKLLQYAHARLSCCPFGEKKTTCRLCPVHCYKPDMRKKMQEVMAQHLQLDSLKFQRLEDIVKAIGLPKEELCTHCWDNSSYM